MNKEKNGGKRIKKLRDEYCIFMFLVHNYMRNFLLASLDVIKKPLNNLELIIRAYASTSYSSATASFSSCEKIKKSEMKFDVASKLSF